MLRIMLFAAGAAALAGCSLSQPVQLEPARTTQPVVPRFTESSYFYDQDQNIYFLMHSHTRDPASGKPIDQIATIRVFWRPKGGVTTLNSTALNATFRYIVMTPDAVGMYEGAGFVRLLSKVGAGHMRARISDGEIRLTESGGDFNDSLGRAHIRGYFTAAFDDAGTLDGVLNAQRDFFARSMHLTPATAPAGTSPAVLVPASVPAESLPAIISAPASAPGTAPASNPAP